MESTCVRARVLTGFAFQKPNFCRVGALCLSAPSGRPLCCRGALKMAQMGEPSRLTSLSALDGAHCNDVKELSAHLSEYGMIRAGFEVLVKWALKKAQTSGNPFAEESQSYLLGLIEDFSIGDAVEFKEIDKETGFQPLPHALRIFLQRKCRQSHPVVDMLLFDSFPSSISNFSRPLMLKESLTKVMIPIMDTLINEIDMLAEETSSIEVSFPTYEQRDTPTTLGQELTKYSALLKAWLRLFQDTILSANKCGGAVDSADVNMHQRFSLEFVVSLGIGSDPAEYMRSLCYDLVAFNETLASVNWWVRGCDNEYTDLFGLKSMPGEYRSKVDMLLGRSDAYIGVGKACLDAGAGLMSEGLGYCVVAHKNTLEGIKIFRESDCVRRYTVEKGAEGRGKR